MDYTLGENSDDLIDSLEDLFGDAPNQLYTQDIRDNQNRTLAFRSEPERLALPDEFDSISIHVNEANDAITEVITLGIIDPDQLDLQVEDGEDHEFLLTLNDWKRGLGFIETILPAGEQGSETIVFWANFSSVPDELTDGDIDFEEAYEILSEDSARNILQSFGVSASRGLVLLEEETLVLTRNPLKWRGTLLAIDLGEYLTSTIAVDGNNLYGPWSQLSKLYGTHYWSRVRGLRLDEFEDEMNDANTNLPPADTDDLDDHLDLGSTIFRLQEDWIELNNRLSRELRQMDRILENFSADTRGFSRRQMQTETETENPDPLEDYKESLSNEIEKVGFDADRLNARLNSLSRTFHNRVSMIGTRENVELQEDVREQTEESLNLQSRVSKFTLVVLALTIVLVFDAAMSGGLATNLDALYNGNLDLSSPQSLTGILFIAGVILASYAYFRPNILSRIRGS